MMPNKGMEWVVEKGRTDLHALQEGGVDAVMFSNEYSLPYLTTVERDHQRMHGASDR